MKICIDVSPLSVNNAWKGRRFKTPDYTQYEKTVLYLLMNLDQEEIKGELSVKYIYHLKNYSLTDTANLEKCLTDILVKGQLIKDDRYIKDIYQRKERLAEGEKEHVDIEIMPYKKPLC